MLLTAYAEFKDLIGMTLRLSQGALHIHLGIVLFFLLAQVLRSEQRFVRALCWLLAICFANEALDLFNAHLEGDDLDWIDSALDIINTVVWPAVWVMAGPFVMRRTGIERGA